MEITSDVMLRGADWAKAIEKFGDIFKTRTHYSIYILAMTIGIMYDQRIEKLDDDGFEAKSVPRNVLQNNDVGKLDFMFQAAILSTTTESMSEEERLDLAFGDKSDFNKIAFLTQFENFGVTKLNEQIADSPLETIEKLKNYFISSVEGRNLDIDSIPDDFLLEE